MTALWHGHGALLFRGGNTLFFGMLERASSTAVAATPYSLAEVECSFSTVLMSAFLLNGVALLFRPLLSGIDDAMARSYLVRR